MADNCSFVLFTEQRLWQLVNSCFDNRLISVVVPSVVDTVVELRCGVTAENVDMHVLVTVCVGVLSLPWL